MQFNARCFEAGSAFQSFSFEQIGWHDFLAKVLFSFLELIAFWCFLKLLYHGMMILKHLFFAAILRVFKMSE